MLFPVHFEQIHRVTVVGAILMGRDRQMLQGTILHVEKIAFRSSVLNRTISFFAGVDQPAGSFVGSHFGIVSVAKRMDTACMCMRGTGHGAPPQST